MVIERHVFGSFKGYTTLAHSPGVQPRVLQHLEGTSYAFGQTYDPAFAAQLEANPAWFTRVLPGGSRALTRVYPGPPDDNGRATLLMISLLFSAGDWNTQARGDVRQLLGKNALWQWKTGEPIAALNFTPAPPKLNANRAKTEQLLGVLSDIERSAGKSLICADSDLSSDDLATIEMLMPAATRGSFTSAYHSLSHSLGSTLNCLAAQADRSRINYRPGRNASETGPYAAALIRGGILNGTLPLDVIARHNSFGKPADEEELELDEDDARTSRTRSAAIAGGKKSQLQLILVASIALVIVVIGGVLLAKRKKSSSTPEQTPPSLIDSTAKVEQPLATTSSTASTSQLPPVTSTQPATASTSAPPKSPTPDPTSRPTATPSPTPATTPTTAASPTQPTTHPSAATQSANHNADIEEAKKRQAKDQKDASEWSAEIDLSLKKIEKLPDNLAVTEKRKFIDEQMKLMDPEIELIKDREAKIGSIGDVPGELRPRIEKMDGYYEDLKALNDLFVWFTLPDKDRPKLREYDSKLRERFTPAHEAVERLQQRLGPDKMKKLHWDIDHGAVEKLMSNIDERIKSMPKLPSTNPSPKTQ